MHLVSGTCFNQVLQRNRQGQHKIEDTPTLSLPSRAQGSAWQSQGAAPHSP